MTKYENLTKRTKVCCSVETTYNYCLSKFLTNKQTKVNGKNEWTVFNDPSKPTGSCRVMWHWKMISKWDGNACQCMKWDSYDSHEW